MTDPSPDEATPLTLKVSGLGHNLTLENVPSTATLAELKTLIEQQTLLPAAYQRLLARGKNLNEDSASLADLGIENRTKLMLLHTPLYAQDKDALEQIQSLERQVDELVMKQQQEREEDKVIHELVTRISCKLDAIDIHGSEELRSLRKNVLQKADALDPFTKE